jgi:hypothetical protein
MTVKKFLLTFDPEIVGEPITYRMVKDFDLQLNILRAEIDEHGGRLMLALEGSGAQIQKAVGVRPQGRDALHQLRHVHLHLPLVRLPDGQEDLEGALPQREVHRLRHVHRRLPARRDPAENAGLSPSQYY